MTRRYAPDIVDGRPVPATVITSDFVLTSGHRGSIHVEAGTFVLDRNISHQGSLNLQNDVKAEICGSQQGSVHVAPGVTVLVTGAIQGSVHVARGGTVIVERGGQLAGSLHNDGIVVVRGVFGGSQDGSGEFRLEEGGSIKQPKVTGDGTRYYEW